MLTKVRKINRKSKTFLTYLISYILILLTPVIILSFILNNYLMRIIKDEVIINNKESIVMTKRMVDMEIKQLHGISYKLLYTNNYLSEHFNVEDENERKLKIKSALNDSILSNLFISEIVLYIKEDSMMYTNNGDYTLDEFFEKMYVFETYSKNNFVADIAYITNMYFVQAQPVYSHGTTERYVAALYPSQLYSLKPKPGLMFLIQEKKFLKYMQTDAKIPGVNSFILDENYNVIAALNHNVNFDTDELRSYILSIDTRDGYKTIDINGESYFMFVSLSDIFSLKYVSILPAQTVNEKITEAQYIVAVGMVLILFIGSFIIYFFMKVNYLPIKHLKTNIQRMFHVTDNELDEIETVKEAINYLTNQNTSLNDRLKESVEKVKDAVIFSLLKGRIDNIQDFNDYGKDLELKFPYKNFCAVIVYIESKENEETTRRLLTSIVKNCMKDDNYEFYCRDNFEKNQYVIIYNSKEHDVEKISFFFDETRKYAWAEYKMIITIGVGNSYEDIKLLPRSYIEASTALRHRFIKGNDQIIMFSLLARDWEFTTNYPKKEITELTLYIKQGNLSKVESIIGNITAYIKNSRMPIFLARAFCFDIINSIMHSDMALGKKSGFPDIFFIESVGTVDELMDLIKELCVGICRSFVYERENDKKDKEKILIDDIVEYIKQNFYKCDFSIQGVSDNFDMKLSYMSQYFKAQMDTTVMDYVTGLRVERAKNLLATTTMSLNYISEEVGYYNVSSFIRRFKQVTKMTPGEFRREYIAESE